MKNPMCHMLKNALCLTAVIAAFAPVMAYGAHRACRFTQRDFVGNWEERAATGETSNDTQELQFDIDNGRRIFRSWLHQRPEMTGTWTFSNCQVTARGPGAMTMTYGFAAGDKNRLIDLESGVSYKRLR
jgi:hypothetical protein